MKLRTLVTVVLASISAVVLSACDVHMDTPTATKTSSADALAIANALTYVQADNKLCFGVGTVERASTGGTIAAQALIVQVDCDLVMKR